jgi:cysteine desulfurase/selenocysteine lyase
MDSLNISSSARASFYIYNDDEDINRLVDSIKKTVEIFA